MTNNSKLNPSQGLTFPTALGLLFIGLKLGEVIDWSWWWVLIPLWGPPVALLGVAIFLFGIAGFMWVLEKLIKAAQRKK